MCQKLCVCSHGSTLNDVWPISRPCSAVINLLLLVLTLLFLCSSAMWLSTGCVAVTADPTEITVSCTETPASPRPRYTQSTEDTAWVSTFTQVLHLYAQFCCTCPLLANFHFKILFYFYTTTGKCFHPLLLFNSLHFLLKALVTDEAFTHQTYTEFLYLHYTKLASISSTLTSYNINSYVTVIVIRYFSIW